MESQTVRADSGRAVDAPNIAEALRRTAAENPDIVAIRTVDDVTSWTWSQLLERVDALAAGLSQLGLGRGDIAGLMLSNRPEFHLADLAVVTTGAAPFSIYNTYPAEQIAHLLKDSGAKLVITEQTYLATILQAVKEAPTVEHVIVADAHSEEAPAGTLSLAAVVADPDPQFDSVASIAEIAPNDLVTLIYTSGTTGPPKGVQITNANIMAGATTVEEVINFPAGSKVISWLPAAHIAERMAHHYIPTVFAGTITVCPNPREIAGFLPQVRPNWFFAVPRIWEKLKAGLEAMLAGQDPAAREPIETALADSLERVKLRQAGQPVPDELEQRWAAADGQILVNIRTMLGLDELIAVNVGAAPLAVDVIEFFHALGIEIAELWGMSETCGVGAVNRPGKVKIGTVGQASPHTELKLGDDGELLIRGPYVMPGYRDNPEKTAEAIDSDGWLHTGDIATIDDEGYVKIVDRKKELIINAAGKNMSPANIEAALKSGGPIIGQACCIGDARSYNSALIVLDSDYAPVWAAQHELAGTPLSELATHPKAIDAVQAAVDTANATLSRVEQIKRFTVLGEEWAPGGDELTPTMKLKRKPIAAKYEAEIEGMYRSN
jgi:long-chain acyl-CoA synthetase